LAERSFRISPRDARANREILEQCAAKVEDMRNLLEENAHLSKVALRHSSLLLQIFHISFLRMLHLASASQNFEEEEPDTAKSLQAFFPMALRHFNRLKQLLSDLAGIPLVLEVQSQEDEARTALEVFQKEESYQQSSIGLLDKAVEYFDEDPELQGLLVTIRQDLVESRKKIRRLLMVSVPSKTGTHARELSANKV